MNQKPLVDVQREKIADHEISDVSEKLAQQIPPNWHIALVIVGSSVRRRGSLAEVSRSLEVMAMHH